MQNKTELEIFYKLCEIPHPSFHAEPMREFLENCAKNFGAEVFSDKAGNILARKGKPRVCLQGHYDMVWVSGEKSENNNNLARDSIESNESNLDSMKSGLDSIESSSDSMKFRAKNAPEPIIKGEWLEAKNSSLGADNGAGCAVMLALLRDLEDIECLFSANEEVGMLGAKGLELEILAQNVLNLDSEDINEIVLGCAGGFDFCAKMPLKAAQLPQNAQFYEVFCENFIGGHSGIEIHKNRANAILELARFLRSNAALYGFCENLDSKDLIEFTNSQILISSFCGGEARNSIPVNARAIVACSFSLESVDLSSGAKIIAQKITKENEIKELKKSEFYESGAFFSAILESKNGVLKKDDQKIISSRNLGICRFNASDFAAENSSKNIAKSSQNAAFAEIYFMGRSCILEELKSDIEFLEKFFKKPQIAAECEVCDFYAPWEPLSEDNFLAQITKKIYEKNGISAKNIVIHAGLECGILKEKFPNKNFISIGPSILSPHSLNERLNLPSFAAFSKIVRQICAEI